MGKKEENQLVKDLLRRTMATKETSLRDLVQALGRVTTEDERLKRVNDDRTRLIETAQAALDSCVQAGWTKTELAAAGITVPRPVRLRLGDSTDSTESESDEASADPDADADADAIEPVESVEPSFALSSEHSMS